jgi:hypothetical protein
MAVEINLSQTEWQERTQDEPDRSVRAIGEILPLVMAKYFAVGLERLAEASCEPAAAVHRIGL